MGYNVGVALEGAHFRWEYTQFRGTTTGGFSFERTDFRTERATAGFVQAGVWAVNFNCGGWVEFLVEKWEYFNITKKNLSLTSELLLTFICNYFNIMNEKCYLTFLNSTNKKCKNYFIWPFQHYEQNIL